MESALAQRNNVPGRRCLMLLICLGLQVCHTLKHIRQLVDPGFATWFAKCHRFLHLHDQYRQCQWYLGLSCQTLPVHGQTCLDTLQHRRGSSDLVLSL